MSNDHWKADWEHIAFNLCSEFGSDFVADKHDFAKAVVREYLRSLRPVDHSELVERLHGPVFGTPTALQAADALDAHNIEIERLKLAIEGETAESISDQQAVDIIEYVWGTAPHQALGDLEEALRTMLRLFDDKQNMVEGPRPGQARNQQCVPRPRRQSYTSLSPPLCRRCGGTGGAGILRQSRQLGR